MWLEWSTEDDCRDEHSEFVDQFRQKYASMKDSPDGFTDMVDLLSGMPELRSRPQLYRVDRLRCMCVTEDTSLLPPVRFQDYDAQSPRRELGDVLLPAQAYLARVPDTDRLAVLLSLRRSVISILCICPLKGHLGQIV